MIIATEIKQRLPNHSSKLERLASEFSDFKNSNTFVAEAEYEALADAEEVFDGHILDNGKARLFRFPMSDAPPVVKMHGKIYAFGDGGPGEEIYHESGVRPDLLPYFRIGIHRDYLRLRRQLKEAADNLVLTMLKEFFGDNYKGICLFASNFFPDGKPIVTDLNN